MISIIVPIYNTEKYLKKCLDSIKNQTFSDIEVIMVDDGSTDGSADICREFAETDPRFKYYYKENGGEGSARNFGLKISSGEYISFIDSDDYVAYDYYELLSSDISGNYDIIQCGMYICNAEKTIELTAKKSYYEGNEFIKTILKRDFPIFLFQTTTTKLYRKDLIDKSGVIFDEKVVKSVDCLFNTMLLPYISKVSIISIPKYYYKQENSYVSKQKSSYNIVFQSIRVGIITSGIRHDLIDRFSLSDDPEIIKGFQTAVCIIYISNAHEIETGGFTKAEKKKLYDSYFSVMDYPIDIAVEDFSGTDKKVALASAKKNIGTISKIYKMRKLKGFLFK